jgi:2,4-dienoyl-CoA reductase-like NADH-dependent reductase (Old Yellow Enzyme family)
MRGVTAKNRIMLSPMGQFCSVDGFFGDWHFSHLSRFVIGGFGIVMVEAASVNLEGRIGPGDLGVWDDVQIPALKRIADFCREYGVVSAIQLGHAGRKGSHSRPWMGGKPLPLDNSGEEKGWTVFGPSAVAVADGWPIPEELDHAGLERIKDDWIAATRRSHAAGFDMVEIHACHGCLLHTFLSPLSNLRSDEFGGDLQGRMRYPLEIVKAVREVWPSEKPLVVRISAVDAVEGGATIEDSVAFSKELKKLGVDFVDCSSGGIGGAGTDGRLVRYPGFQVPFSDQIRHEAEIGTIAVGLIVEPQMANQIIEDGQADIVAIGREALVYPNWAFHARKALFGRDGYEEWPAQVGWWLNKRDESIANSAKK